MPVSVHASTSASQPLRRLIEEFPALFAARTVPRRGFAARHSRIDEFAAHGNNPPFVVKTITESCSPEHAARVASEEFAALAWLRARVGASLRDTIPEPLAWVPGSPAIAMRKLDGVTLAQLLRRHATYPAVWGGRRLVRIGDAVGRWLRAMHDATRASIGEFDAARLLEQMDASVAEAASRGLTGASVVRIVDQAAEATARLARTPVPRAARQGDFTVSNILVDGPAVRIVDFENFGEADAVYEDLASFVGYLRMLGHGPAYSRARLQRLRHAFLDAYGQRDDDPVLALYELKQTLAILAQFPRRPRWPRRQALEREILGLAAKLNVEVVRYKAGASDFRDASRYDEVRYRGRANEYKREVMKRAYTGLVGPSRGQRLLDVGCGTGRGLRDLEDTGARLFGSDASVDMLAHASGVHTHGSTPLLAAAYAQHLPYADGSFDTVVSLNFLHLFSLETQRQMIAEMKRVVKPGGRLVLEFDNALHGLVVGPIKRWTGRERGSVPREIRSAIGNDCRILRRRGAVYPVVWRVLSRWPAVGMPLERLAYLPGIRHLAHRVYYEVEKPAD